VPDRPISPEAPYKNKIPYKKKPFIIKKYTRGPNAPGAPS